MAQQQDKPVTGGNKPKPGNAAGGPGGQSAKDKSRAQSRPVTGKDVAKKAGGGGAKGGNTPRPGGRPVAPTPRSSRISPTLMAWSAVGLVIVVVVVLVAVRLGGGGSTNNANATFTAATPAPAGVVHDVTNIPMSVYNTVGINSTGTSVSPPTVLKGQPPLTLDGQSPSMLYYGAEYCPYCAAERWGMTAALSRFGTFTGLKITASSHTDVFPETHTFSYSGSTYTSPYIHFFPIEQFSTTPTASGYAVLQNPTAEQKTILTKYSSSTYLGAGASSSGGISFPFVDVNNVALFSGASYSPGILVGDWSQIASGLNDPSNKATQAIVATANYFSAAICASTKGQPGSVCKSPGVMAATKALKLS